MPNYDTPNPRKLISLAAALAILLPVLVFAKLGFEVREAETIGLDVTILNWLHQFASPTLDSFVKILTDFGGAEVIIVVTAALALILFYRHQRSALTILLVGVGGAAIINTALKLSFQRHRPTLWTPIVHESSYSFPSGHAMMSSALALSLILILWKTRWRWWAILAGAAYALVIGLTRMYLGVHYPTDIVAGWIVSFVWLSVVYAILTDVKIRWRQRTTPPAP